MIGYATIGSNDLEKAKTFYDTVLAPLGGNEIVRISTTSGKPVSRVYPGGSCSQYCMQVYAFAGAVWEPTAQQIIRLNPAAMPD